MGLLDGDLQTLFGNVFRPFFLDGTLHKMAKIDDGMGGMEVVATDHAIKGMKDSWRQEYAAYGVPRTDVVILVLQLGMTVAPKAEDQITLTELQGGVETTARWACGPVGQDPASAHWIITALSIRPPAPGDSDTPGSP